MHFDDFYQTIGEFGRYQKVKYFFICCTYMITPIFVYTWTFTAATPSFTCRLPESMDNHSLPRIQTPTTDQCRRYRSTISVHECQRCYQSSQSNGLESCQNFTFNRTFYQSTLVEEWSMICDGVWLKSMVQMVFFSGYMIGSLVFGILSDRFGRRPIMGISFLLITVAGLICAFVPGPHFSFPLRYGLYTFGRFLLACATRGVALTGFVIGVEIVGPKQRQFTGIVIQYFFAFGELVLLAFAYLIRTWRSLQLALACLPIPFLFFYFILPESPRWLISNGRYDEAEKILRLISKTNKTKFDELSYQRVVHHEQKKNDDAVDLNHRLTHWVRSKVMMVILLNMSFQWFIQNLVFYGVSQNTGSWSDDPYTSFGAGALIEIISYLVVHIVMSRYGRKPTYSSFVIGMIFITCLVLPIEMLMVKNSFEQNLLIFFINVASKFFATGSYAIIYIYANKVFPTRARNTGIGICSMLARFGAMMGTFSNDLLTRTWLYFPIVIYGVGSLLALGLITICPETARRELPQTLEDVERIGLKGLCTGSKSSKHDADEDSNDAELMEQIT